MPLQTSSSDNLVHSSASHSLDALVRDAVANHLNIPVESVNVQPNKDKYHDPDRPEAALPELREVFSLMSQLNGFALDTPGVAANEVGYNDFGTCLDRMIDSLAAAFDGRTFRYVELGPEPNKTRRIIGGLIQRGVRIANYVAVDINPASSSKMREALDDLLPSNRIRVLRRDFQDLDASDVHDDDLPILATTLGFQEGNDHPTTAAAFFEHILRPGDLLLSEMQVATPNNDNRIEAFYRNPLMRRFSRLSRQHELPVEGTNYRFFLLPVSLGLSKPVKIAVMCEDDAGTVTGQARTVFVTNYCLKYTREQFRQYRESNARFEVLAEQVTGDDTVVFQLARCLPMRHSSVDAHLSSAYLRSARNEERHP